MVVVVREDLADRARFLPSELIETEDRNEPIKNNRHTFNRVLDCENMFAKSLTCVCAFPSLFERPENKLLQV